ncbi:hypothetical protein ACS0TY_026417 [Phlomoides rotata]
MRLIQYTEHDSDDKGFKRKDWNQNGERDQYQKQDMQTTTRYYGGRSKNEDHGSRQNQESSREKQYRQRSPSRSDDKSHRTCLIWNDADFCNVDAVLCCLPHGTTQEIIKQS